MCTYPLTKLFYLFVIIVCIIPNTIHYVCTFVCLFVWYHCWVSLIICVSTLSYKDEESFLTYSKECFTYVLHYLASDACLVLSCYFNSGLLGYQVLCRLVVYKVCAGHIITPDILQFTEPQCHKLQTCL